MKYQKIILKNKKKTELKIQQFCVNHWNIVERKTKLRNHT